MNTKKIVLGLMASLAMSGFFGMVSFAETASKAPAKAEISSKTTEKSDAAKKKTDAKSGKEATASATAGKATAASEKAAPAKKVVEGDFHGNTEGHIFHKSSCKFYKSKNSTAIFKTRDEAIKAGYKPCKICKP